MTDPSKKAWFIAGLLLIFVLAACQQLEPTPTESTQAPKLPEVPLQAIETTMLSLLRNPVAYEGQLVRLSGAYKPQPIAICQDEVRRSPASWSLVDGEAETLAAGFDTMLRELAYSGITLVVEGQWRQWVGPVGCGRRVPESQIWYLDVTNIISPNPLVVSTPEGGELVAEATSQIAATPSATVASDQQGTAASEEELETPETAATVSTGTAVATVISTPTRPTNTPGPSITATSPTPGTVTATTTPTVTGTPNALTATAGATGTNQTDPGVSADSGSAGQPYRPSDLPA